MTKEEDPTAPVRLRWLVDEGLNVWVWCEDCSHHASLAAAALLARFGDVPVKSLAQRMKCSKCQGRHVFTRPDWPKQGLVTRHDMLDD